MPQRILTRLRGRGTVRRTVEGAQEIAPETPYPFTRVNTVTGPFRSPSTGSP